MNCADDAAVEMPSGTCPKDGRKKAPFMQAAVGCGARFLSTNEQTYGGGGQRGLITSP